MCTRGDGRASRLDTRSYAQDRGAWWIVANGQESNYLIEYVSHSGVGNLDVTVFHIPSRTFLHCTVVHYESAGNIPFQIIRQGGLQP